MIESYLAKDGLIKLSKAIVKAAAMIAYAIIARGSSPLTTHLSSRLDKYL